MHVYDVVIESMHILSCLQDINECEDPGDNPTCHEHAKCIDTEGSYECTCNTGFSGDGFNCSGFKGSNYALLSKTTLIIIFTLQTSMSVS